MVEYDYDAWGNHTVSGSNIELGNLNPFRYRGYYYDIETGLYYLQTRYYDPETGYSRSYRQSIYVTKHGIKDNAAFKSRVII